jgi:hypothetical protein
MRPYYQDDLVTIYHGDCRAVRAWLSCDLLVTDPPYGMAFVSSWTTQRRPIEGDRDTAIRDAALVLWGDRPAAVFGTWKVVRPANTRHRLIWDKSAGVGPGMGDLSEAFGTADEEIYLLGAWPKRTSRKPNVLRTHEAVGSPNGLVAQAGHPTPKPPHLIEQILRVAPLGSVADPFCGTGGILLAAKNLGRQSIGVEINEAYCERAADRCRQEVLDLGVA